MELSDGPRFVGLHVLQVEATNQEVIAPDVFRDQVHLEGCRRQTCISPCMKFMVVEKCSDRLKYLLIPEE